MNRRHDPSGLWAIDHDSDPAHATGSALSAQGWSLEPADREITPPYVSRPVPAAVVAALALASDRRGTRTVIAGLRETSIGASGVAWLRPNNSTAATPMSPAARSSATPSQAIGAALIPPALAQFPGISGSPETASEPTNGAAPTGEDPAPDSTTLDATTSQEQQEDPTSTQKASSLPNTPQQRELVRPAGQTSLFVSLAPVTVRVTA